MLSSFPEGIQTEARPGQLGIVMKPCRVAKLLPVGKGNVKIYQMQLQRFSSWLRSQPLEELIGWS